VRAEELEGAAVGGRAGVGGVMALPLATWEWRPGHCPLAAPAVAVGLAGRLRCASRSALARRNSLHSLRSLRSDNRRESEVDARAWRAPSALLRCSPPHKSVPPGTAHRAETLVVLAHAGHGRAGKAVGGCAPAATYAAPRSEEGMAARAQRAHRPLTCRDCLSATTAGSEASFSAGHAIEHRREPCAQRRAAASERRRIPARGFARSRNRVRVA
jgi:hypothetical protein